MYYARAQTFLARAFDSVASRAKQHQSHGLIASIAAPAPLSSNSSPDLERPVYCVLGLPIDAVDMRGAVRRIEAAAIGKTRCLVSTANLNFLVESLLDPEFRETLLDSDLCTADGMPIVWIARLLDLPIARRVAGADLLETLRANSEDRHPLAVFLFGGGGEIAAAAGRAINTTSQNLRCVGTLNPGFGGVEELSQPKFIETINASGADFLVAALGAKKGQLWLHRNRDRLAPLVLAHLGATINFAAGSVKRAPQWARTSGLEWLWRIKEEPYLWSRYARDFRVLIRLLCSHILPLCVLNLLSKLSSRPAEPLGVEMELSEVTTLRLSGSATEHHIGQAIDRFGQALASNHNVRLDLANVRHIDPRFFGLIMMIRKCLKRQGRRLDVIGVTPSVRRLFRLHNVDFLLSTGPV